MPNTHRRRRSRHDETVLSRRRRRGEHEFATSWRQFCRVVGVNTSVGSRREFMYTPSTPTRRDKTVSSRRRRRCVLGIIGRKSPIRTHPTLIQRPRLG